MCRPCTARRGARAGDDQDPARGGRNGLPPSLTCSCSRRGSDVPVDRGVPRRLDCRGIFKILLCTLMRQRSRWGPECAAGLTKVLASNVGNAFGNAASILVVACCACLNIRCWAGVALLRDKRAKNLSIAFNPVSVVPPDRGGIWRRCGPGSVDLAARCRESPSERPSRPPVRHRTQRRPRASWRALTSKRAVR